MLSYSTALAGNSKGKKHALRAQQREALERMIEQAVPMDGNGDISPAAIKDFPHSSSRSPSGVVPSPVTVWRIIIFDDVGRSIIAPMLKVVDLREHGVTLYMHLDTERDAVQGAPVVYFCAPTPSNLEKIAKDCDRCLYEWYYINFTCEVPRACLERLADLLAQTSLPSISHIKVFDRTLQYVALSDDLFSLMLPSSFSVIHSGSDSEVEQHMNAVVRGISHVLLSMQLLPLIVHSKSSGAAVEIARRVGVSLSDALADGQLTPPPTSIFGRPLLLLVDRAQDLACALHHPFTYRGLLSDAAAMDLNIARVKLSSGKEEQMEVDPERDAFYAENGGLDFGEIGGRLEAARQELLAEQAELSKTNTSNAALSLNESDAGDLMSQLVANAPVIAEKKRVLDMHTKMAYGLLELIRHRKLDVFSGVEKDLLCHSDVDQAMLTQLLKEGGTLKDRQRLFLIAYLMKNNKEERARFVQEHLEKIERSGATTSSSSASLPAASGSEEFAALRYVQQLEKWSSPGPLASPSSSLSGGFSLTVGGQESGLGWGIAQVLAATIGGAAASERELPLTQLISVLLEDPTPSTGSEGGALAGGSGAPRRSPIAQNFSSGVNSFGSSPRVQILETLSAYDVRSKKTVDLRSIPFSQAIVFSIGGGCVAEYEDLQRWESRHPKKSILYGCTSLMTGEGLLEELSTLGKKGA